MTIAMGFVVRDGLLLCADTLYSDGHTKEYRDKLFSWIGKGAAVCFGIAGNGSNARMAVDECMGILNDSKQKRLSSAKVFALAKPVVKKNYEQYVDARPDEEKELSHFEFLMGVAAAGEEPKLFATSQSGLSRVDTFRCAGTGRWLANYLIEPVYRPDMTTHEATTLAIYVLASAKDRVDGIGGHSQFLSVENSKLSPVIPYDVSLSEQLALDYQRRALSLLFDIADPDSSDERFRKILDRFGVNVEQMRKRWKQDSGSLSLIEDLTKGFVRNKP